MRKSTWRDTALTARVGPIDARVCLVLPVFFLYMRPSTLMLLIAVVLVFTVVDLVIGHRLPTVLNRLRLWISSLGATRSTITPPRNSLR